MQGGGGYNKKVRGGGGGASGGGQDVHLAGYLFPRRESGLNAQSLNWYPALNRHGASFVLHDLRTPFPQSRIPSQTPFSLNENAEISRFFSHLLIFRALTSRLTRGHSAGRGAASRVPRQGVFLR